MPTDEPVPYSFDEFGSSHRNAHDGFWQYVGGRCSVCKSISPFTLNRLVDEFNSAHMIEMTELERLELSEQLQLAIERIRTNHG